MATYIPSATGEALQRSSENLINLILSAARIKLDRDELAQRAMEFERQQAFIESGRPFGFIADRISAAGEGQRPSDLGIPEQMWQQAGLGDLLAENPVLTPETAEGAINRLALEAIRSGGLPDTTLERAVNRVITGEAAPDDLLALQDLLASESFEAASQKFLSMTPRQQELFAETTIGLPQSVRFRFGGEEIQFESSQALSGALGFMNLSLAERQMSQTGRDIMLQYREALKERMEQTGVETFGLGNARARAEAEKILNGVYDTAENIAAIEDPRVRAFVEAQLASRDLADGSLFQAYLQSPEGQPLRTLLEAGEAARAIGGEERAREYTELFLRDMERAGWPAPRVRRTLTNILSAGALGGSEIEIPRVTPQVTAPRDAVTVPEDLKNNPVAVEALEQGVPPEFIRGLLNLTPIEPR